MSLFTDIRDQVEDAVGVGPNSDVASTISSAVLDTGRAVGTTVASGVQGGNTQPPAPSAVSTLAQKVEAAVGPSGLPILLIGGAALLFLALRRKR